MGMLSMMFWGFAAFGTVAGWHAAVVSPAMWSQILRPALLRPSFFAAVVWLIVLLGFPVSAFLLASHKEAVATLAGTAAGAALYLTIILNLKRNP